MDRVELVQSLSKVPQRTQIKEIANQYNQLIFDFNFGGS